MGVGGVGVPGGVVSGNTPGGGGNNVGNVQGGPGVNSGNNTTVSQLRTHQPLKKQASC